MPSSLVASMCRQAESRSEEFKPQDIANTLWALATAGEPMSSSLVVSMCRQAESISEEFKPQAISITLWAACVSRQAASFDAVIAALLTRLVDQGWSNYTEHAQASGQLHQCLLSLQHETPQLKSSVILSQGHLDDLAEHCRKEFTAQSHHGSPSKLQRQVAAVLRQVLTADCVEVLEEQVPEGCGGYSVDVLLRGLPGRPRVVVEVDGPSHFVGQHLTGSTQLKHRLLRAMGWEVVQVPYFEWPKGKEQRASYVRTALQLVD